MNYSIEMKNELSGTVLIICFPEKELDKSALRTIQYDLPNFLVPFRCQTVDGQVKMIYQIGNRSKIRHFAGPKTKAEYLRIWESLLQPLIDCGDWFLNSFSFIMKCDFLFYEKTSDTICYLYVPTKTDISSYEELQDMMNEMAKINSVSDRDIENTVLRMLLEKVGPAGFLEELRKMETISDPSASQDAEKPVIKEAPEIDIPKGGVQQENEDRKPKEKDDIDIRMKAAKKPKENTKKKAKFSLFSGKKEKESKPVVECDLPLRQSSEYPQQPEDSDSDTTLLEESGTGLRLVGKSGLAGNIPVEIEIGGFFSIGRYDIRLGQKQSSFEFPAATKAVSRKHAVIERDADGYTLTDLASKAGTFVNGVALASNVPHRLRMGEKISFGTGGADYIWEE